MSARRWAAGVLRVITTRGRLAVRVCRLCAAVVVADGAEQHELFHAATLRGERST